MGPCYWRLVAGRRYLVGPSTVRSAHPPSSCAFRLCTSLVLKNALKSRNIGTNLLIPCKNDLCLLTTLLFYSIFFGLSGKKRHPLAVFPRIPAQTRERVNLATGKYYKGLPQRLPRRLNQDQSRFSPASDRSLWLFARLLVVTSQD
jgi:hypothetical protein